MGACPKRGDIDCGMPHPKCAAHNRAGGPCGRAKAEGQQVCVMHGARNPHALAKAETRIARERALGQVGELLEEMDAEPTPHPLDGLEWAYRRAHRMVQVLEVLVGDMDSPLGSKPTMFGDVDVIHPLTALYGEWLDRYAKVQKLALDAGIDERRQRIQEAEVDAMFSAIAVSLNACGLTPQQQEAFRASLATELRRRSS